MSTNLCLVFAKFLKNVSFCDEFSIYKRFKLLIKKWCKKDKIIADKSLS